MKLLFLFLLLFSSSFLSGTFNLDISSSSSQNNASQNTSTQNSSQEDQSTPLNLSQAMSSQEQEQTGFNRLTSKQKDALNSWVENWSQQQADAQNQVKPNGVSAVVGEGHYVKLGDSSVWNISPNAWIYTYYWQTNDSISVSKSPDTLFPYQLTNENYSQTVNAQKASNIVSQNLQNAQKITAVSDGGRELTLSDGSIWLVGSAVSYQSAGWSVGQTVFVVKQAHGTGGQYNLHNGDNSRSVYATPIKKSSANNPLPSNNTFQTNLTAPNGSQNSFRAN